MIIYSVYVSCFPASEYGDHFTVVARDEEGALRIVAGQYDEDDSSGRCHFYTLYTWWKEPYQNRAGYYTGVTVTPIVELDKIVDERELTKSLT